MRRQTFIKKAISLPLAVFLLFACGGLHIAQASQTSGIKVKSTPKTWFLQARFANFTSVYNISEPELLPQAVKWEAGTVSFTMTASNLLDEEFKKLEQKPLAIIIKVKNSTQNSHTLILPWDSDLIVHTHKASKPALAMYGWWFKPSYWGQKAEGKAKVDVKAGESIELLYLISRFSGEATIELRNIGSIKVDAPH